MFIENQKGSFRVANQYTYSNKIATRCQ